nr:hypothetical protein [Patescibacteria group bacterium]
TLSLLILNYSKSVSIFWKLLSNIIFYFLSFSLFLFIFKLGYGFDPFIHKATMDHISQNGFILPKNPYYVGQYGLIIFISKITGLSIAFLNKALVVILASLLLPIIFFKYLKKIKIKNSTSIIPLLLVLGFSPFIFTTPQNLSYLFLILTIFYSIIEKDLKKSFIFSLSTAAIHPLSGLPAIFFFLFSFVYRNRDKFKKLNRKLIYVTLFLLNSIAIPFSLFITAGKEFSFKYLISNLSFYLNNVFNLSFANKGNIFLNTSYFFINNYVLFILILIIFSLIYIKKISKENRIYKSIYILSTLSAGSLIISFLITSSLSFSNVISYEQRDYALRILKIFLIHLLPVIIIFLSFIVNKIRDKKKGNKISAINLACVLITISLYSSYPRIDKYYNSRGYNTSYYDLKAVNEIESDANGNKYFVLANQQVSAAALYEFGFEKNISIKNSEHYFYPIPTGGLLYNYYLDMVYDKPSYENIKNALDLTKVDFAYLVINKYWYRSAELINIAKIEADSYFDINNEVYIFKYIK